MTRKLQSTVYERLIHSLLEALEPNQEPPLHPGQLFHESVLLALGISTAEAAQMLKVSRQALHRVLTGRAAVSPDMALRFAKFSGTRPDLWLHLEGMYDLWHTRKGIAAELAKVPDFGKRQPEIDTSDIPEVSKELFKTAKRNWLHPKNQEGE